MESDYAYFSRRAAQEHRAAAEATSTKARAAHYELARRHRLRAQLVHEPSSPVPIRRGATLARERPATAPLHQA